MTLTAAPLTITRKNAAVSATLVGHTTDPGVLAVTYPTATQSGRGWKVVI